MQKVVHIQIKLAVYKDSDIHPTKKVFEHLR